MPKSGSDGLGLTLLAGLGHAVHATYPALTPLVGPASPLAGLAGISLPVTLAARGPQGEAAATGGFLFTHRGYSGPAVLDVSHIAVRSLGETVPARVTVRWTGRDASGWDSALRAGGARTVAGALRADNGFVPATNQLRVCLPGDPKTFDPLLVTDLPSETYRYLTAGVLVRFHRGAQRLDPELVETWQVLEGGRRITFRLRQGIRFSDGTPFSAEDIADTVRRMMDPNLHSPTGDTFRSSSDSVS